METTGIDTNHDVICRSVGIQLETEEVSTRQEETMQSADSVLKSLSPLINSMRLFGLYFTRESRADASAASQQNHGSLRRCHAWNPGYVYSTVMLVLMYMNAFRYCTIFDGKDTFGVELLLKLCLLASLLLIVILQTAYYVASHTGSLDRVCRQVYLSSADISPKYSRRAKIITFVCWTLVALNTFFYIYPVIASEQFNDPSMAVLFNLVPMSKPCADIIKVVFFVLDLQSNISYVFPQAMKCMFSPGFTAFIISVIFII